MSPKINNFKIAPKKTAADLDGVGRELVLSFSPFTDNLPPKPTVAAGGTNAAARAGALEKGLRPLPGEDSPASPSRQVGSLDSAGTPRALAAAGDCAAPLCPGVPVW
jgi:hypothetical protein